MPYHARMPNDQTVTRLRQLRTSGPVAGQPSTSWTRKHGILLVPPAPCQASLDEILAEKVTVAREAIAQRDRAELANCGYCRDCLGRSRRSVYPGRAPIRGDCIESRPESARASLRSSRARRRPLLVAILAGSATALRRTRVLYSGCILIVRPGHRRSPEGRSNGGQDHSRRRGRSARPRFPCYRPQSERLSGPAAVDGNEAIAILGDVATVIDVVVSDVDMPGATGLEVAAFASSRRPGIGIVLTSGTNLWTAEREPGWRQAPAEAIRHRPTHRGHRGSVAFVGRCSRRSAYCPRRGGPVTQHPRKYNPDQIFSDADQIAANSDQQQSNVGSRRIGIRSGERRCRPAGV